ncbi:MAG: hypothetical protein VXW32_04215 [Myxococcota bacterium]|nr:hypothetical protein [Myxococcota bacterium]
MARVVLLFLCAVLGAFPTQAEAAGGTLVVLPEGTPDEGLQREIAEALAGQGISVEEFTTISRLARRLQLVPVQPNVLRAACLERIEMSSWQRDARRVEMLVQTFRGRQALDLMERLEDQLVCLDGVVSRRALRELAVHRILAMSLDGAGLLELEDAVEHLRSLGDDLVAPTGLPSEIQSLIMEAKSRREPLRVFGGGPGFEVFVDGESLLSGAVLRGAGKHLVQLVDARTGQVSTAQWVSLNQGPVLIWGGEASRSSLREVFRSLADEGTSSQLLRSLSVVLRNTLLVADLSFRGFRILHVDGRMLVDSSERPSERRASRPEARRLPEAGKPQSQAQPVRTSVQRSQVDRRLVGGAGVSAHFLAVQGVSASETGLVVWGRFWSSGNWGGKLSLGLTQQPKLLEPADENFYDLQLHAPLRLGGAWSPKVNPLQPDVSIHLLAKLGHSGPDRLGAGFVVGVLAPVWGLSGLRMQAHSEFGGQWWSSGITVGGEWSIGVEN